MALQDVPSELIERCRQGDPAAFEDLVAQIGPDLYRMVFAQMRNHDDTDEVMQECLIRIYRHLNTLREVDKFSRWVARMTTNQCHSHRAKRARTAMESTDDTYETHDQKVMWHTRQDGNPRTALMRKEVMQDIHQAIGDLPPRQRAAIVLFEVQGCSIREVSEIMECSEGAVKFNIHQARKKLKTSLRQYVRKRPSDREKREKEHES